ncbi:MAG: AglZ/HisF2 family acetamidino modification protein [Hyphomicrobiaceae bacterium]|nr:AglZ/HisF2 family acetamidino modification protein [Hyphomicrobiaceae bacterium]
MLRPRIIPCLLVHNGGLVKTVGFKDPKYVGDPINAVKIFNEKETDELMVLDIDATAKGRDPDFKMIADLAVECRMPLCYGGGVRTPEHAKRIIELGVEKVSVSSAAIEDPGLVTKIAGEVGRQSMVVTIDVRRRPTGYEVFTHNGQKATGISVEAMAKRAEELGAGELVINAIDDDGMMKGYDLDLARRIRGDLSIPMTYLGGAGKLEDIGRLFEACGVVGAAAGSLFVFKGPYRAVLINYPNPHKKDELVSSTLGDKRLIAR